MWSRFFKKRSKKGDIEESDGDEEKEEVWNDKTRDELFSEFDIDESDVSPWEGGRPDDVQVTAQFKLNRMGVSLRNNGSTVLEMRFTHLATSVVKQKEFLQLFAGLNDLSIEDESEEVGAWTQVVYPEKNAVFDATKPSVFSRHGRRNALLPSSRCDSLAGQERGREGAREHTAAVRGGQRGVRDGR